MVYKMITSKSIIAKVIADLGLDENKIKISDITEWIGEGIQKIGSVNQKRRRVAILELKDYQCKLPCDLQSIDIVAYSHNKKNWILMHKTTDSFGVCVDKNPIKLLECKYKNSNIEQEDCDKTNLESTDCEILKMFTQRVNGIIKNIRVEYDIKPGYLVSNIKEGFVKIAYYAEYVDDDGMPLIPDLQSYQEALYWYVAMKLLYIEYFTGRKPQNLYYDAKRSWNFYRQQAYAESMMPNSNEIENIKNTWHTLMPKRDEMDNFFYNMSDEQIIYTH